MSKKNLKKALIPSVIALVLCFAMLLGTTFAWFTDTAESTGNVITSGKLDIDLQVKTGEDEYTSIDELDTTAIFNYDKWEPGYTAFANVKVVNNGNLAIKYYLTITGPEGAVDNETYKLAEVIDVYYAASEVDASRALTGLTKIGTLAEVLSGDINIDDTLEKNGDEDFATIALVMSTEAGNEYQELSVGTFTVKVVATQATYESDSIDDQYDASAE
ncbi:MAG: hypothetical protein IJL41_06405 [Clostridia bacterium]|nr:hypothetical protein [Clostridia bacterium]